MATGPTPGLSVIVATHNRRELLDRCLRSLCRQSGELAVYELIVADDGSTDGTAEIAESRSAPFPLRVLRLEKGGQPAAQNAAIEAAGGRYCLFLDDDTIASAGLCAAHLAAHRESPPPGVLGIGSLTQEPHRGRDWYAKAFAAAWAEHYEDLETRAAGWWDCYGANFSAPRAALLEAGGFSTDLPRTIDLELAFRLCEAGLRPTYLPRAHAVHDDQKGRHPLLADAALQGTSHVEMARRHPATTAEMLNWAEAAGPRELLLRRLALVLRIRPRALVGPGALLPGEGRKMLWMHFVRRLAFWRAARRAMSRRQWRAIARRPPAGGPGASFARTAP